MRHLVLGTAGHIDHGKSALVRALTGVDPDRLKEERERGITIELGFADLDLGSGRTMSIVDVPGHERFVRHMVAGAAGIDAVALVVAADEGVRPQTVEHLAICGLLGVRHGLTVLTKLDLVDREIVEVVSLEVREFLAGSFLAEAPIVAVSARTGEGLDVLRASLAELYDRVPGREAGGIARLPVDRSFVLKGFGTVVTGTLVSGTVATGDEVEILPGSLRARIRGLQVHGRVVESASAGRRTAVNLQGASTEEVPRGATLTVPGALRATRRIWARITLLGSAPASMRRGGPARFHQGTCERAARYRVLHGGENGTLDVELWLGRETVLVPGDRFVLRRPAPLDTVGGGVVLDIAPPRGRSGRDRVAATAVDDPEAAVLERLRRAGARGAGESGLGTALGRSAAEIEALLERPAADGRVVRLGGLAFDAGAVETIRAAAGAALAAFHEAEPLRPGMPREELRSRVAPEMARECWRALLQDGAGRGELRLDGERVALAAHRVRLEGADRELARRLEARFLAAGLDAPDPEAIVAAEGGGRARRILDLLVGGGILVRIRDGRLVHASALDALYRKLEDYARTSRMIDVATFKALAGVTRKNAIPLLEHLDGERRTRRVGNAREILID